MLICLLFISVLHLISYSSWESNSLTILLPFWKFSNTSHCQLSKLQVSGSSSFCMLFERFFFDNVYRSQVEIITPCSLHTSFPSLSPHLCLCIPYALNTFHYLKYIEFALRKEHRQSYIQFYFTKFNFLISLLD